MCSLVQSTPLLFHNVNGVPRNIREKAKIRTPEENAGKTLTSGVSFKKGYDEF